MGFFDPARFVLWWSYYALKDLFRRKKIPKYQYYVVQDSSVGDSQFQECFLFDSEEEATDYYHGIVDVMTYGNYRSVGSILMTRESPKYLVGTVMGTQAGYSSTQALLAGEAPFMYTPQALGQAIQVISQRGWMGNFQLIPYTWTPYKNNSTDLWRGRGPEGQWVSNMTLTLGRKVV